MCEIQQLSSYEGEMEQCVYSRILLLRVHVSVTRITKNIPTKSREANEYRERLQYLQSNKLHWKLFPVTQKEGYHLLI